MNTIKVKRIYEEISSEDGCRILVDRLWPRGMTKEKAAIDRWTKNISPSTELRKTFSHNSETMDEFTARYIEELDSNKESTEFTDFVKERLAHQNVTLLYSAKNEEMNHAIVLMNWLNKRM